MEKRQELRDYKLTVEYKHLRVHAPGGVYVVPNADDLRLWHGAIFVRRGLYAGGIFRFRISFPPMYNDHGTHPVIHFSTPVFSPLVDPATGELALKAAYPEWDPSKHYVFSALVFVKKVFYIRDFENLVIGGVASAAPQANSADAAGEISSSASTSSAAAAAALPLRLPNREAVKLYATDRAAYLERVQECVRVSQERVYENPPGSSLRFTEPKPMHNTIRAKMWAEEEEERKAAERREAGAAAALAAVAPQGTAAGNSRGSSPARAAAAAETAAAVTKA